MVTQRNFPAEDQQTLGTTAQNSVVTANWRTGFHATDFDTFITITIGHLQ
jgi:hypothetical protein